MENESYITKLLDILHVNIFTQLNITWSTFKVLFLYDV